MFELGQVALNRSRQHCEPASATTVFFCWLVCKGAPAYFVGLAQHGRLSVVYRCNQKHAQEGAPCSSPHLRKDEIKTVFERLGMMLERRSEIFSAYGTMIASLTDSAQQERTQARSDEMKLEMEHMVCKNAEPAQNQDKYKRIFDALRVKCNALKERSSTLKAQLAARLARRLSRN